MGTTGARLLPCPQGLPGGPDGKESACSVGDPGLVPGSGRSPGGGNGNRFQYSCPENPMDRGAWRATVHGGLKKSDTTERLTRSRLAGMVLALACQLFKRRKALQKARL